MEPAPTKTRPSANPVAPLPLTVVTNPALEEVERLLAHQNQQLDAAFSSVAGVGDVHFAVNPQLLEDIETACTAPPNPRCELITLARC